MSMRIAVIVDIAASTEQTRVYAEYRVFASLATFSRLVREVDVTLQLGNKPGPRALCAVSVNIASGVQIAERLSTITAVASR
jgi:hypothetical protein